jgi:hypothetical protein
MSDTNANEDKKPESRPLGAVLGWLNLSPTLSNNPDDMAGATAGRTFMTHSNIDRRRSNLASPPRFIDYNQLMEANRNAQNLQLAHEIVFNKDFQLQLPEYEKGT